MDQIKCPECGNSVSANAVFCPHCGINLKASEELVCPVCHRTYPAGYTFCSADGSQLVPPGSMIRKCVICGTQYNDINMKYCPKDGGAIVSGAYNPQGFPQGIMRYQKASLGNRFLACLLDGLITVGLMIPSIVLYVIGMDNIHYNYDIGYYDDDDAIPFFIIAAVLYLIPIIYGFIKDGLGKGQSWGKKAMNLRVIRVSNYSKCSKWRSTFRFFMGWLIGCIPIIGWLIEPILVLATSDGRRLADRAAGTMVVNA